MVRGARSGTSSVRGLRGRALFHASIAGPSFVSPTMAAGSVPEDAVSLQEGGGSFYESTLREVWINGYII
ncbi:hypothetical protein Taro_000637 [Colocasia esculenta]|uniref:Uncharacterized protein n=1 Tax=Colocasia esculenta TaxID=4460 RepID=A0A843TH08_COLES|nr:hypothetical protein [Colocasia esculenta]